MTTSRPAGHLPQSDYWMILPDTCPKGMPSEQTVGYGVYTKIGQREDVVHLACWVHARREFEKALDNDRGRAGKALSWIQRLYEMERQVKERELTLAQCKELRLEHSLPIINQLEKWIHVEA